MKGSLHLVTAWRITLYCPVSPAAWPVLWAGDLTRLEQDILAAPVFAALRANAEFGTLGPYRQVYEMALGHESFSPTTEARPTLGKANEHSLTMNVVITTYVAANVSKARREELIAALAAAHPWEVPVMEIHKVRVLEPDAPPRP